MRRTISLILAMLMVLSISAPVLASDEPGEDAPAIETPVEPEIIVEPEVTPEPADNLAPSPEESPELEVSVESSVKLPDASEKSSDEPELAKVIKSGKCGKNLTWQLDNNGVLTISGNGPMWDWGYFAQPWSSVKDQIATVVITDGVTSIGDDAFPGYDKLTSVIIPNSVTSIGKGSFQYSGLVSVTIPKSATSIGTAAFQGCCNLSSITIFDGVSTIGWAAFFQCESLTSVNIPNSVTSIGKEAFAFCKSLTSFTIPQNVVSIGEGAFGECSDLTSIIVLNPECDIIPYESNAIGYGGIIYTLGVPGTTTIYGHPGSTAEIYAQESGFAFKCLDQSPVAKNGWVNEKGQKYYYQNGKPVKGLRTIDKEKYYFSAADGRVLKGTWVVVKGARRYYAGEDGVLYTGYKTIGNQSYYFSVHDGHLMKGGVVTGPGSKQYYVSAKDGHAMKNGWARGQAVKGKSGYSYYYYLDKTGVVRVTRELATKTQIKNIPIPKPSEYQS